MSDGFLLIDKPAGITSHDVVAQVRRKLKTRRVGHAGTLDPMATGVLVMGVGIATRLLPYITDGMKEYQAGITLGATTTTDDIQGEVLTRAELPLAKNLNEQRIREKLSSFVGEILQRPSSVSAIKVDGKRAYERVRAGESVELAARKVYIESIAIESVTYLLERIEITATIRCSAGTYIRAIARDLGQLLGVGGYLHSLRRTEVAPFTIAECQSVESAELLTIPQGLSRIMPTRELSQNEVREISFGRFISPNENQEVFGAVDESQNFVALVKNRESNGSTVAAPLMVAVKE